MKLLRACLSLIVLIALLSGLRAPHRTIAAGDLTIYGDALASEWQDWSWDSRVVWDSAIQAQSGKAVEITYTAAFAGFSVRAASPINAADYSAITFWVYGGPGGSPLELYTQATDSGNPSAAYRFTAPAGNWARFTVPLSQLGSPAAIARITIQDTSGAAQPAFYLDDLRLVASDGPLPGTAFPDPTADTVIGVGTLDHPAAVAIGPNGRVFVADSGKNRVLSWPDVGQFTRGQAADLTLGDYGNANNQMNGPESIVVDSQNRVYVADTDNHRVLVFVGPLASGMSASYVFGTNGVSNALENRFQFPRGMAFDPQGDLLLVDEFNNRVLVYRTPFQHPAAPDFTPDAQFNNLFAPRGVAVDGGGNVYITDSEHDVVREYDAPLAGAATTISAPNLLLGTLDAAGIADCNTAPLAPAQTTQATLACPIDVAVDASGNVYVADIYNHRVVAYQSPATTRDTTPDALYGQAQYTDHLPNRGGVAGLNTLNNPLGMAFDAGGNLYLADLENSRVLRFKAPAPSTSANITINAAGVPITFSPTRLLGVNTAAWLHPSGFADQHLIDRTRALGNGLLRLPGGSDSQTYGELSCELGAPIPNAISCTDASNARLSDFITFLQATGRQAIYTININTTPEAAAALVAFFNADVSDPTVIGTDSNGADWKTAGDWARLRAQHGHPDPVGIRFWDFGNETYGGVAGSDPNCQDFGWEHVWTCNGAEYINGARGHAGYRQFRAAMRAIDPTLQLGAVGFEDPAGYNNWTNNLLSAGGDLIDFLTIHPYPYDTFPPNNAAGYAQILALPQTQWPGIAAALHSAIHAQAGGRAIPIWVTEYNLGSPAGDTDHLMARAVNGLYIADSIGQQIVQGYAAGLPWDLVGVTQANGANMGLMNGGVALQRQPSYYAFPLWARFGDQLLPSTNSLDAAAQLSVYAGRVDDRTISLLAINKTGQPINAAMTISGVGGALAVISGTADVVQATALDAQSVQYNGVGDPADTLADAPSLPLTSSGTAPTYQFAPYSITLLRLRTAGIIGNHGDKHVFLPLMQR